LFFIFVIVNVREKEEVEEIDSKDNLIRLVTTYKNLVFSVCLKMTGDYFIAEDITQETFIQAYQNYDKFDGTNEKAWICRIASNKCIDWQRETIRKSVEDADDETISGIEDTTAGPLQTVLDNEVIERLEACCNLLKEPYRSVSIQFFIEGLTAKEISDQTGTGLKTVQTQIFRAKEMLKKTIRREDLII